MRYIIKATDFRQAYCVIGCLEKGCKNVCVNNCSRVCLADCIAMN